MYQKKIVFFALSTAMTAQAPLWAATTETLSPAPTHSPHQQPLLPQVQHVQQSSYVDQLRDVLLHKTKIIASTTAAREDRLPLVTHLTHMTIFEMLDDSTAFHPFQLKPLGSHISGQKKERIENGRLLLTSILQENTPSTVGELKGKINAFIERTDITNAEKLCTLNIFRHVMHVPSGGFTVPSYDFAHFLGEFASEYGLSRLIRSIEANPQSLDLNNTLAEVYYHLSQTYSHLATYEGRVSWSGVSARLYGDEYHGFTRSWLMNRRNSFIDITYDQMTIKRFDLLTTAIALNPIHHGSWLRIVEYYLHQAPSFASLLSQPARQKLDDFFAHFTQRVSVVEFSRFHQLLTNIVQDEDCDFARTPQGEDGKVAMARMLPIMTQSFLQTPQYADFMRKKEEQRKAETAAREQVQEKEIAENTTDRKRQAPGGERKQDPRPTQVRKAVSETTAQIIRDDKPLP